MTQTPPTLFDIPAMLARRNRARFADAYFLHQEIAEDIQERLQEVNKTFTAPAIVGWQAPFWARVLGLNAKNVADSVDTLALQTGAHDLVIHALGLHWVNDPVGHLVQCRHALAPDGLLIAALFGGQTLHELRSALAEAEIAETGGLSPRVAPMGELRDLGGLLQRAGLALPVADMRRITVNYASPLRLIADLRAMGETNILAARHRTPMSRALLARMCAIYAEHFPGANGGITATFEVAFLTGWAPDARQQKPLRPGSAAARLAEALGTTERPAGEKAGQ